VAVPIGVVVAGISPDLDSWVWVSGAVLSVAAGIGIVALMFARHSARRIRLTDLTTDRAYPHSEGIPDRLSHYKRRLMWERVDGVLSVALPVVLVLLIANVALVALISKQASAGSYVLLLAVPLSVAVSAVAIFSVLSADRSKVEDVVREMGPVTSSGPLVAELSRDLEAVGIALGLPALPAAAVLESSAYNAFAVGRDVECGMIVVTSALSRALEEESRLALITQLTLRLRSRSSAIPSDDTRQLTEQLLDLETVMATGEPDGMLGLLRFLSDRETSASAWYRRGNPIPVAAALIWPLIDLEDLDGQTADRILMLDEALRAEGYYVGESTEVV